MYVHAPRVIRSIAQNPGTGGVNVAPSRLSPRTASASILFPQRRSSSTAGPQFAAPTSLPIWVAAAPDYSPICRCFQLPFPGSAASAASALWAGEVTGFLCPFGISLPIDLLRGADCAMNKNLISLRFLLIWRLTRDLRNQRGPSRVSRLLNRPTLRHGHDGSPRSTPADHAFAG